MSGPQRPPPTDGASNRPRGRPRHHIDPDTVAGAVAELFDERGFDAVSISATAKKLGISRATLYRTVPSKEHLLAILFERSTRVMYDDAGRIIEQPGSAADRLAGLIRMQVHSAIRMSRYLPIFFEDMGFPPEIYTGWRQWQRRYEQRWVGVVAQAITDGALPATDPAVATRLIFGMCLWVSRWYRPGGRYTPEDVADDAVRLILDSGHLTPAAADHPADSPSENSESGPEPWALPGDTTGE